ncbi:MAG: winged helix-turn-helix domain-containing protein [Bacteroidales bacterium]|nr:winged helix-turn-helix domain-containing protein [Bacteroidales bacterium]
MQKSTETRQESTETQRKSTETRQKSIDKILKLIEENPQITTAKIAMAIGLSNSGVEKNLRTLKEMGIIKRVSSPTYGGHWEIVSDKAEN